VVIDEGVHEGISELWAAVTVAGFVWGGGAVLLALLPADVAPATAVRDVPDLLHVYVYQRSRVRVLVPADRLSRRAVDVGEACSSVRWSGCGAQLTARFQAWVGPSRNLIRRLTHRFVTFLLVLPGEFSAATIGPA
jgi:hypothetical protein